MVSQQKYKDTHPKQTPKCCFPGAGQRTGLEQGLGQHCTCKTAIEGTRCGVEIRTKALLLLLCLLKAEQESGVEWDTGLIKPEQDGCEWPAGAQGTVTL